MEKKVSILDREMCQLFCMYRLCSLKKFSKGALSLTQKTYHHTNPLYPRERDVLERKEFGKCLVSHL